MSFIALIYFILATGPSPKVRLLPWLIWGQLALDAFMVVLWLAASASSHYNCNDLCNACNDYTDIYYDNLYCYCVVDDFYKRDYSPAPKGALSARTPRTYGGGGHGSTTSGNGLSAVRQAFDSLVTFVPPST